MAAKIGSKGVLNVGQFAAVKLAFEFQADEQKENRHQRIVDPMLKAQTTDLRLPQTQIICAA